MQKSRNQIGCGFFREELSYKINLLRFTYLGDAYLTFIEYQAVVTKL